MVHPRRYYRIFFLMSRKYRFKSELFVHLCILFQTCFHLSVLALIDQHRLVYYKFNTALLLKDSLNFATVAPETIPLIMMKEMWQSLLTLQWYNYSLCKQEQCFSLLQRFDTKSLKSQTSCCIFLSARIPLFTVDVHLKAMIVSLMIMLDILN